MTIPDWPEAFGYSEPMYRMVFAAFIIFFTFFYISITVGLNKGK